jgi:ankyrin repeat protein
MDLSTRVSYLNSLLDQGSITEEEYFKRTEPIRVASDIIQSCVNGDTSALTSVLAQHPKFELDSIVEQEATPLHAAITTIISNKGNPELVRLLLLHGSKVDKRKGGYTPLMSLCTRASCRDATECARLLIQNGADVTATATVQGSKGTVSCLSAALRSGGPVDLITLLCQSGASPRDEVDGSPAVNYCIVEGKTEQAIVLLQYGADPNSREPKQGATCLASAVSNGYLDVVQALMIRGAQPTLSVMRDQSLSARDLASHLAKEAGGVYIQIASLLK